MASGTHAPTSTAIDLDYMYVAPGADADAGFRVRGMHDLIITNDSTHSALTGWLAEIPTQVAEGETVMKYCVPLEVTAGTVDVDPDVYDLQVLAYHVTSASFSRYMGKMHDIGTQQGGARPLAAVLEDSDAQILQASPADRAALRLARVDLASVQRDVQAEVPPSPDDPTTPEGREVERVRAAAALHNANVEKRALLSGVTFGALAQRSGGRARPLAMMAAFLGSHITVEARNSSNFMRGVDMLLAMAAQHWGVNVEELTSEEVAESVVGLFTQMQPAPALARFTREPGGAEARLWVRTLIEFWLHGTTTAAAASVEGTLLPRVIGTAVACFPLLDATLGRAVGGTGSLASSSPSAAISIVRHMLERTGVLSVSDPVSVSAMREIQKNGQHMTEMLRVSPWSERSPMERAEFVVERLRVASTLSSRGAGAAAPDTDKSEGVVARGTGAIPKHYQDRVAGAIVAPAYRAIKAGILEALRKGGPEADLDALQIAATGVVVKDDGTPMPRQFVPLIVMMAEGPARGVAAELVDPELAELTRVSRTGWSELAGRSAALQMTTLRNQVPAALRSHLAPELFQHTSGDDWGNLDLGAIYRATRAALRGREPKETKGLPYTSHEDVCDALEVAEPLMSLRGFPGDGIDTLPFVLQAVAQTWRLYGGEGASSATIRMLADEGRQYVVDTLRRFGTVRSPAVSGKDPRVAEWALVAPTAAKRAFGRHEAKLAGAVDMEGYTVYLGLGRGGGRGGDRDLPDLGGAREEKKQGGAVCSVKLDLKVRKAKAFVNGKHMGDFWIDKVNEGTEAGREACLKGAVAVKWGIEAVKSACSKCREGVEGHEGISSAFHKWKQGKSLKQCRVQPGEKAPGAKPRVPKRARDDDDDAGSGDDRAVKPEDEEDLSEGEAGATPSTVAKKAKKTASFAPQP